MTSRCMYSGYATGEIILNEKEANLEFQEEIQQVSHKEGWNATI